MSRAKSISGNSEIKIYLRVGYNTNASYVSKDAPAEVQ
jgi:hypothetical protein